MLDAFIVMFSTLQRPVLERFCNAAYDVLRNGASGLRSGGLAESNS
jgi:hypothetical protein